MQYDEKQMNPYKRILDNMPCQLLVIDADARIVYINPLFLENLGLKSHDIVNKPIDAVLPNTLLRQMLTASTNTNIMFIEQDHFCIQGSIWQNQSIVGAIQLSFPTSAFSAEPNQIGLPNTLDRDLKTLFGSAYDVIYISDEKGVTKKVSDACETLWGLKKEQLIGKSVYELESAGIFVPSVTRLVLETGHRVQSFQETQSGRKLMVIGTPVKDQNGKIRQVINFSKDISSERALEDELSSIRILLDAYKHELSELRAKNAQQNQIIYSSTAMATVVQTALKVSAVDSTVMITGESGVGKEVLASFIHQNSGRREQAFIRLNCGAIPESLLESELFGYEKGAFTGANKDGKPGLFELAHQGTIFLDEITETSPRMQIKLLRILQEGSFIRVGGTRDIKVDVRILAASNKNLQEQIERGLFREDLFYRLNVVPIHIPPLRERLDDIPLLTAFFLERYNEQYHKRKGFDPEVITLFQDYPWPGNIRELQNIVERLVVLADNNMIRSADLPEFIREHPFAPGVSVKKLLPIKEAICIMESQLYALAAKKYKTTIAMADALGVNQSTVSRKLKIYGIKQG